MIKLNSHSENSSQPWYLTFWPQIKWVTKNWHAVSTCHIWFDMYIVQWFSLWSADHILYFHFFNNIISFIFARCRLYKQLSAYSGKQATANPVTKTFNLSTSNKMVDQDLPCTIHLPSLVMICPVVFVLECWHTHTHRADKCPTHTGD